MKLIKHIIEPQKLLLLWQAPQNEDRRRFTVAEITSLGNDQASLQYLTQSAEFKETLELGFEGYPAFPELNKVHSHGVVDALMQRLPPRSRGDFFQYLEFLRIPSTTPISNFALLGYSGAKLPSDGFSVIHPFENIQTSFEFLLEAAGSRFHTQDIALAIDVEASFEAEPDNPKSSEAIQILVDGKKIGYVTQALLPTMHQLLKAKRIISATIERISGQPNQSVIHLFVQVAAKS